MTPGPGRPFRAARLRLSGFFWRHRWAKALLLLAPPLLVIILVVTNDKKIMAGRTNGRFENSLGILAVAIMGLSALALLVQLVTGG